MVHDATTTELDLPRRHTDPPQLWLQVVAGSVAVHLLLIAIAIPLTVRISSQSNAAGRAATPIEWVELPASDTAEITAQAPAPDAPPDAAQSFASEPDTQALASPAPATEPADSVDPLDSTESLLEPALQPSPEIIPDPAPQPDDANQTLPEQTLPEQTLPERNLPGLPQLDPADPNPFPDAPSTPDTVSDPFTGSNEGQIASAPPDIPIPEAGGGNDLNLPDVAINREPIPASYQASVSVSSLPSEQAADIPDQLPVPIKTTEEFIYDPTASSGVSNCVVSPESARSLGATASFQVVIDEDGRVEATFPRPGTEVLNPAYVELADCVLKNWQFSPAVNINPNDGSSSAVFSDQLIVSITITQL